MAPLYTSARGGAPASDAVPCSFSSSLFQLGPNKAVTATTGRLFFSQQAFSRWSRPFYFILHPAVNDQLRSFVCKPTRCLSNPQRYTAHQNFSDSQMIPASKELWLKIFIFGLPLLNFNLNCVIKLAFNLSKIKCCIVSYMVYEI